MLLLASALALHGCGDDTQTNERGTPTPCPDWGGCGDQQAQQYYYPHGYFFWRPYYWPYEWYMGSPTTGYTYNSYRSASAPFISETSAFSTARGFSSGVTSSTSTVRGGFGASSSSISAAS